MGVLIWRESAPKFCKNDKNTYLAILIVSSLHKIDSLLLNKVYYLVFFLASPLVAELSPALSSVATSTSNVMFAADSDSSDVDSTYNCPESLYHQAYKV